MTLSLPKEQSKEQSKEQWLCSVEERLFRAVKRNPGKPLPCAACPAQCPKNLPMPFLFSVLRKTLVGWIHRNAGKP